MWTWEQIERDWLGGARIAVAPDEAVAAFNRVDSTLGAEWMSGCRGPTGDARGTSPTLSVVNTGQRLATLEGVANCQDLIEKIRSGDQSASAELTAIYLVKSGRTDVGMQIEPEVQIGNRTKKPDFRTAVPDSTPTCVEVTQPNLSEEREQATRILDLLTSVISEIRHGFALEVFLHRVPTVEEAQGILDRLPTFCTVDNSRREELGSMGFLQLNVDSPGSIKLRDHGEESTPRIGVAKFIRGPDEPHRHVVVRLAFSDERAHQFLRTKARQLPKNIPGLIMVQMSHAPGGFKTWEPILRQRLQPTLHTRVSAICLFESGLQGTSDGEAWIPRTKLIVNPHAKRPLPDWIVQQLDRFASDW